jgi:hypothetical protein
MQAAQSQKSVLTQAIRRRPDEQYVVHPLDDEPEEKRSPEGLGPMQMSGSRKVALIALRGYLIVMMLLLAVKVVGLSGLIRLHA